MFAVKAASQAYYIFHLRRIVDPGERGVIVFSFGFVVHDMTVHFGSCYRVYLFCFIVFLEHYLIKTPNSIFSRFIRLGEHFCLKLLIS